MATRVQYTRFGGPEVLEVVEIAVPRASTGLVVVEVRAAGVNPIDWKLRSGLRSSGTISEPRGVGSDASGVVIESDGSVESFAVGDEVIIRGAQGAYASHLAVGADQLVHKPAGLDWARAAALGIPVSTAYQALRSLGISAGETVLIHAGAGAVGQAAVQFAREWGATAIATASAGNHARLAELGAIPVAYGPGLADRVREAAPGGIDAVLDAAGTDEAIATSLELVADRSRIGTVVVGAKAAGLGIRAWMGGSPIPLSDEEQALRAEAIPVVADLIAAGRFDVEIFRSYPLDEASEAHRVSEQGHVRGKIVLVP